MPDRAPQLLLVAHGSRDPRFGDTARRVRAAVARALPRVDVELSFLDLDDPLVGDVLAADTADRVVVPLLLAPGYHSEIDLPRIIGDRARGDVRSSDVVGRHPLTDALADRLTQAGLRPGDGIIVTAVGSTNPAAASVVRRRAIELSTKLHRPVDVVFATRLGAQDINLRNAIRRLAAAGSQRVVVSPYFLSAGLLTERVENALDRLAPDSLVAGPIGTHPALIDAVVASYRRVVDAAALPAQAG
ncbi:sirohydrochlorin chelatase [Gordonia sp. CPCC 206044]